MNLSCFVRSHRLVEDPYMQDVHTESCLRCQVEAVRYRTLARSLAGVGATRVHAPPGFVNAVRSGLGEDPSVPKKSSGIEAVMATAGVAAVALALWRRSLSA